MENKNEILEENALGKTLGAAALAASMAFGGNHSSTQPPKKPASVQYQNCHAKNVWANPKYNELLEKYQKEYLRLYPKNYWKALTLAEEKARNEVACGTYKLKGNKMASARGKPMNENETQLFSKALQEGYQTLFGKECPESLLEDIDDAPVMESGMKDIALGLAGMGVVGGLGGAAMLSNDAHQAHLANMEKMQGKTCVQTADDSATQAASDEMGRLLTDGYRLQDGNKIANVQNPPRATRDSLGNTKGHPMDDTGKNL